MTLRASDAWNPFMVFRFPTQTVKDAFEVPKIGWAVGLVAIPVVLGALLNAVVGLPFGDRMAGMAGVGGNIARAGEDDRKGRERSIQRNRHGVEPVESAANWIHCILLHRGIAVPKRFDGSQAIPGRRRHIG